METDVQVERDAPEQPKRPQPLADDASKLDNAETVAVREFETTVAILQIAPQLPDPELPLTHIDVVEKHHRAIGELRQPGCEIMRDIFVSMPPVDVQQVDRTVAEVD